MGESGRERAGRKKAAFPEIVMSISVVMILVGMQLVYHDYYFDMLNTKYRYYYLCALAAIVLCLAYVLVTVLLHGHGKQGIELKGRKFWDVFNWTDIMVLLFEAVVLVSTLASPFRYEAFWGNEGRFTGAFLLSIYSVYYFCCTRFYRPKTWHTEMFLIAGMLMCLFGITDAFDLNLLGFKDNVVEYQRYIFTSTIGNINTYTSCVAMVVAVAAVLFTSCEGVLKNVWYGICVIIAMTALVLGESDNSCLSMAMLFGFLPFYLFRDWKGVRKFFTLVAIFFTIIYLAGIEQRLFADTFVPVDSFFVTIAGFRVMPWIVAGLWILVILLCVAERSRKVPAAGDSDKPRQTRILIYVWCGIIAAAVCAAAYVIYDVNVAGNVEKYAGLENYLLFNDAWGTNRGFAWRIALENYREFPLVQKLLGYGPDTFSLVTYFHNYAEMTADYGVLYDSVHNEYLQYLVTIGPIGLLSYLGIMATVTWNVAKKKLNDPMAVACLFAVLCYGAQATVNINQPIATPIMWTFLCMAAAKNSRKIAKA